MGKIHDKFCEFFPLEPGQGIDYDSGEWNGFLAAWELFGPVENNAAAQAGDEPMQVGWLNVKYGTFFQIGELAASERTTEMLISGEVTRVYSGPGAKWACPDCSNAQRFSHRGCVMFSDSPRATADVERDKGLEAAAELIDRKVKAYDDDMGSTDRETGTREYPGDGGEWVNEMGELAEEIRALKSVATTKPGA